MCGLNGIVNFQGLDPATLPDRMARSLGRMANRGPDGAGDWSDGICALGHRRLSIVDLNPTGDQPMVRDDHVIGFNGMVYNFKDLRAELQALGAAFQSTSDTEVLLEGWKAWGEDLLPRLQGMFVFAIWERQSRRLILARDRFGKKPLVFRANGNQLAFASDLRALQYLEGRKGDVDAESIRWFFTLRYLPPERSILKDVQRLPPGSLAVFDEGGLSVRQWWSLPASALPEATDANPANDLRALVQKAVEERLVADVPVGAFLSGGIDSAIVSACMVASGHDTRTFTVGFRGATPYYEERPAAKRVADHLGTRHTEIEVDADTALGAIDAVFDGLDEPFADSSAIPTYLVSRETRKHVTVALSGDGADEVFGGYRKYQGELQAAPYQRVPGFVRRGLLEPIVGRLPERRGGGFLEKLRRIKRFVREAGKSPEARQAGWAALVQGDEAERLFLDQKAPKLTDLVAGLRGEDPDPLNAMLRAEVGLGLPGDMLTKVDRMSMANGLEVRCPLLDHRVVAFAFRLPGSAKIRKGIGKAVLREAFADALPAETFTLPKKGFEIPLAQWFTGPLRPMVEAAINPMALKQQGLFDPELPSLWFKDLQSGRRDTVEMLWSLIAFQAWQSRQDSLTV